MHVVTRRGTSSRVFQAMRQRKIPCTANRRKLHWLDLWYISLSCNKRLQKYFYFLFYKKNAFTNVFFICPTFFLYF